MGPMELPSIPAGLPATRRALQRVAAHVVARRRSDLSGGRIGLRPSPGGIACPPAGPEDEVVRTDGDLLIVERGRAATVTRMTTLADLAGVAAVDPSAPLALGANPPPAGDLRAPLDIDAGAARALGAWWAFAVAAMDEAVAGRGPQAAPSPVQLWPEHFDVGCDLAWGPGEGQRVNLGGSPGDDGHEEPYLYVGPWGPDRPGDPTFWNAPFGAELGHAALRREGDPFAAAVGFLRRGLELLAG